MSASWRFLPACQSQAKDVSTLSNAAAAARPSAHFDPAWHSFQTHTHDCARHAASRPIWVNSRFPSRIFQHREGPSAQSSLGAQSPISIPLALSSVLCAVCSVFCLSSLAFLFFFLVDLFFALRLRVSALPPASNSTLERDYQLGQNHNPQCISVCKLTAQSDAFVSHPSHSRLSVRVCPLADLVPCALIAYDPLNVESACIVILDPPSSTLWLVRS